MKRKNINDPNIGQVVYYWGPEDISRPIPVYIVSGDWTCGGRLSNFWTWRKIKKDGSLTKKSFSGYGNFSELTGAKVSIKVQLPGAIR